MEHQHEHLHGSGGGLLDWFSQQDFMPHGHCYLWKPGLVWTHVISDSLIGLAYVGIALTLWGLVKKIKIQFNFVVIAFGVFILACGLTHLMEIWNLWNADYWASAWVKVLTAIASVATGIYLWRLRHPILTVAEAAKLSEQRRLDLEALTLSLEQRVEERTRELRESEAKFRQMMESIPQLGWVTDAKGRVSFYNQRYLQYTGVSLEKAKNDWLELIHPDDREETKRNWLTSLEGGVPYNVEMRIKGADGSYRWFLTRALPLLSESGEVLEWYGTCTDIDQQKHNERELARTVSARDQFLSIASHELKTPITSLLLQTQMVDRNLKRMGEVTQEEVRKLLGVLRRQSDRLNRLVSDMLDVSRIQTGRFELQRENREICVFVKNILDVIRPQFTEAGHELRFSECGEVVLPFDELRIEQVLANILMNALKYAPDSDVEVRIEIIEDGKQVRIDLQDWGPGIGPELLEKIFTRFERAGAPQDVAGLGLGLYISRQIIQAHGGRIWAESELGKGTIFRIILPIGKTA